MTIHWKAVEQYFTVVLFVFQYYPVSSFGLGNVRSERIKKDSSNFENFVSPMVLPWKSAVGLFSFSLIQVQHFKISNAYPFVTYLL